MNQSRFCRKENIPVNILHDFSPNVQVEASFSSWNTCERLLCITNIVYTSTMRSIGVGTNLERIIIYIQDSVKRARTHLNEHVTTEGEIVSLDKQCEYCKIFFKFKLFFTSSGEKVFLSRELRQSTFYRSIERCLVLIDKNNRFAL